MVKYIKKRKLKNDNRYKYIYYKIDGKIKKKISSKEYYKYKKIREHIGGNNYKSTSILQTKDNSPIHGSIKQITRVDKNLIDILSKYKLSKLFKREKDIVIHGIPYVSYKMSPNTLKKLEELQNSKEYNGPQIFGKRVTYFDRNMHKDMYIWNLEGEEDPDIEETIEDNNILSKKSLAGKGLNPLTNKRYSEKFLKKPPAYYAKLPIYIDRNHVRAVIKNNQITLIQSGTGSGKSVIVPKIALQIINYGYGYTSDIDSKNKQQLKREHKVIMTLPKRILASSSAEKSASDLDVIVGEEIGYKYKNSSKDAYDEKKTVLLYATDGTLLSKLQKHPTLQDDSGKNIFDIIIIDEVHERNERIDMIIHMMKYALNHNPSLKLILMSATIDATPFIDFFSKFKFQAISISGQPMKTIYPKWIPVPEPQYTNYQEVAENQIKTILENEISELDDEDITNPEYERMKYVKGLYDDISDKDRKNILDVQKHVQKKENDKEEEEEEDEVEDEELNKKGAILFFDVDTSKAKDMCSNIRKFKDDLFLNTDVVYCKGLSSKEAAADDNLKSNVQSATKYKNLDGQSYGRKVIISTNLAESSLTIEELSYVIDSGYERKNYYDPERMMQILKMQRISKAQAKQRWGRVGRTKPGLAIKLYTQEEYNNFDDFPIPDLLRMNCIPMLFDISEMMEKKNKYSEVLHMKYHNSYNIESIEELMVKTNDFFITPVKQEYFNNAKNILKKLKCFDKNGFLTLDFYLIREIFNIITEMNNDVIDFNIFDARMILESFIYECVDEVIEIIVCCKHLRQGTLTQIFKPETPEEKKIRISKKAKRIINKKKLYKKYKKIIDQESDHITILNLYQNYKKDEDKLKKMNINITTFDNAKKTLNKSNLIESFIKIFENNCKKDNVSIPTELGNPVDYIENFVNFIEHKTLYLNIIKDTIYEFITTDYIKKKMEKNNLILTTDDIDHAKITNWDKIKVLKILHKIFDEKYLSLKDRIILKLKQIFNQKLNNDNNRVFKKINHILQIIKDDKNIKDDNSMKTKILHSLYLNDPSFKDDSNYKSSQKVKYINNPEEAIGINSKKEFLQNNKNSLKKKIIACIVAGYSVHICQYQKQMEIEENEQKGGFWWLLGFGKTKEDVPDQNYVNCFPNKPTHFTFMFDKNQDKTFVNFEKTDKKYIIYNTLSIDRNKPIYYSNIITIIPPEFLSDKPTDNNQCGFEPRIR